MQTLIEFGDDLRQATLDTLMMVLVTMLFAVLVGTPLGVLLFLTQPGGLREHRLLNFACSYAVNVLRSFPFIILLVVLIPFTRLIVGTSIGPAAAAIGLSVAAIPFFSRMVEQSLRDVPKGVVEAALAFGATTGQIVREVLIPEAMPALVSSVTLTTVSFLGYSAVAGAIGAGGIGDLAIRFGYYRFETGVMVWCVVIMFVLITLVQWIGNRLARLVDRR